MLGQEGKADQKADVCAEGTLLSFDFTAVMLEFRMLRGKLSVIVDADHKDVPSIMFKPVKIFPLPFPHQCSM